MKLKFFKAMSEEKQIQSLELVISQDLQLHVIVGYATLVWPIITFEEFREFREGGASAVQTGFGDEFPQVFSREKTDSSRMRYA